MIGRTMTRKKLAVAAVVALLGSPALTACDKEDRPEVEDIEQGVEDGADEVQEQVDEGAEENNDDGNN